VDAIRPATRWLVRCFLLVFLICGTFGLEAWPFTAFRLFSRLRGESRTLWVADTVNPQGAETHLWFTELPRA